MSLKIITELVSSITNGLDELFTSDDELGKNNIQLGAIKLKVKELESNLKNKLIELEIKKQELASQMQIALLQHSGVFGKFMYFFNRLKRTLLEALSFVFMYMYIIGSIDKTDEMSVLFYASIFLALWEHLGERGLTMLADFINRLRVLREHKEYKKTKEY